MTTKSEYKSGSVTTELEKLVACCEKWVSLVKDGEISALEAYSHLIYISKIYTEAAKQIKESALDESISHTGEGNTFTIPGYQVTLSHGKSQWDFTHIPQWVELKQKLKEFEGTMKTAYHTKDAVGVSLVDEETGEIYDLPILKKSASSLSIKKTK